MSFQIDDVRSEESGRAKFVAKVTLYLDADANVLTPDDDETLRRSLLVREGGTIPMELAERYGLASGSPDEEDETNSGPSDEADESDDEPEAGDGSDLPDVNGRMSRDELDAIAIDEGLDPEEMDNKAAVLAAIEENREG